MTTLHDAAILGATPAGFAAAYRLAKAGADVIVLDSPAIPAQCPLTDWTSADFFRLPGLPAGLARAAKSRPFQTVHYHSVALDRYAEHHSRSAMGYFLQSSRLTAVLAAAARKAGARRRSWEAVPLIRRDEDRIVLSGASEIAARVLLLIQGQPEEAMSHLGLTTRTMRPPPLIVAGLDVPTTQRPDGALHVVEEPERSEIGMFFVAEGNLHLRVISSSPAAGTRAAELSALVARCQQAGAIPAKLPLHRARGAVWRPPAGVALELETHVAKRCLLAGTAGGFADAVTGGTLYASVASALLAAEVAAKALEADDLHATLAAFQTSWRRTLEQRLLQPATPFRVLLPLVFANPKVASRLTAALLYGQEGAEA